MPSPLSVEYGFLPHVPSPAGDFDCGEYFDFAAYERDRGDGVLHHHHHLHHHPRLSSEGPIHTPALTAASTATPPSDHFEGLGRHAAAHLNSLPGDLGLDDDEWAYSSSDLSHGDFSLMLNSDFPSSSSSSSSYSSSPPSYSSSSSSSHPPSSASSPPSSYPPSPPSFPEDARRGRSETSSSSGSSSKGSKKRHLHRPEQTAEVRENGACIRCRIRRVRCDLSVCEPCTKFQYLCIHDQLSTIGPVFINISHRYTETIRRHELTGRRVDAPITFTTDPRAPKMELTIQEYSGSEKGASRDGPNCAIPREYIPSWGTLASWAGQQILCEAGEPFQKAIESFIIVYSDRPNNRDLKLPKFDLVDRVRKLTCMFKIWMTQHSSRSNGLYYRGDKASRDGKVSRKDKGKGDPERLPYSVHEELRHIAKKAMESLERDILGELDACMTQSGAVKPYEKPLLWACLWQLIFVYGQLLENSSSHPSFQRCREVTRRLYMALVAYYTGFFNTPKSLQLDLDLSRSRIPSQLKDGLAEYFRAIIDRRLDFYQMLRSSRDDLDGILADAIAENELKRLLKRRSRKTHTSVRGSKVAVDIVDDDVEMGYY